MSTETQAVVDVVETDLVETKPEAEKTETVEGATKGKKKKSPPKCRAMMYVQSTAILLTRFKDKDTLVAHLDQHVSGEWAFITHDKDFVEDEHGLPSDVPAHSHVHIAFYFSTPRYATAVAKMMGETGAELKSAQNVELFNTKNGKASMFSYLIHATTKAVEQKKHQYSVNEVTANFDFAKFVGRVTTIVKAKTLNREEIQTMILEGTVIKRDFFIDGPLGTASEMALFYTNNKSIIEKTIEARYATMMTQVNTQEGGIEMEVIYIQGDAGSGKTSIAKEYANRKYGCYFLSGSSNDAVQDYMGEPVAIFDDARPTDFSSQDWLKLLDPYSNGSSVRSRYYNKYLAVKCIILTTTTPFEEFWLHTKKDGTAREPIDQFLRRFNIVIKAEGNVRMDGTREISGAVHQVEESARYQMHLPGAGSGIYATHKVNPTPVGKINIEHAPRMNMDKAQSILDVFN